LEEFQKKREFSKLPHRKSARESSGEQREELPFVGERKRFRTPAWREKRHPFHHPSSKKKASPKERLFQKRKKKRKHGNSG